MQVIRGLDIMLKRFNLIKDLSKDSYSRRLNKVLSLFLLVPFSILVIISLSQLSEYIKNNTISKYDVELSDFSKDYEKFLIEVDEKLNFLVNYDKIRELINLDEKSSIYYSIDNMKIIDRVVGALISSNYKINIRIYTDNDYIYMPQFFSKITMLKHFDYYDKLKDLKDFNTYYAIKHDGTFFFSAYTKYTGNNTGIVEISVPCSQISKLYKGKSISHSGIFININDINYNIANWQAEDFINSKNAMIITKHVADKKSSVFIRLSKSVFYEKTRPLIYMVVFFILFMMILIFGVSKLITSTMTKKLNEIIEAIIENDISFEENKARRPDEFDLIANKLMEYSKCIKEKNENELIENKKRQRLELTILQERISPHFLYNTLASIKWVYKDAKLRSVIDSIVKYYRISLNRGSCRIAIKDELEGIGEYLRIQQFAYGKNFNYKIDIEHGLEKIHVLKNMLQPVVENAFLHGVNLCDDGLITINVKDYDGKLFFIVENNGPVISDEAIARIHELSKNDVLLETGNKGGYAIANLIQRIKLYYGDEYGINVYNNSVTRFEVIVPYGESGEEGVEA